MGPLRAYTSWRWQNPGKMYQVLTILLQTKSSFCALWGERTNFIALKQVSKNRLKLWMGSEGRFPLTMMSVMRSQPIGAEDKTFPRMGNCKRHWAVREGGVEVWEHTESCGLKLVGKEEQGETRWQRATLRVQRSQHSSVHLTPRPYAKTTMAWFTKENDLSGCLAENAWGPRVETR